MNSVAPPRITIADLPPLEFLSEEEKALIFGAGRERFARLGIESLETRELMAANLTATFSQGLLHITDSNPNDRVVVQSVGNALFVPGAVITGASGLPTYVAQSAVQSVRVDALGGNDTVWLQGNLGVALDVHGIGGDTVVAGSNTQVTTSADPGARLVTGNFATVWGQMDALGQSLGQAITGQVAHRLGGTVQQFQWGDVWVNGSSVQVYNSNARMLQQFSLSGASMTLQNVTAGIDYDATDFLNYRTTYDQRPTLFVVTHGLAFHLGEPLGYGLDDWQNQLGGNLARQANAAGSMARVLKVDWASWDSNTVAVQQIAQRIENILLSGTTQWDVMLVGHSRGGIISQLLPAALNRTTCTACDGTVPATFTAQQRIRTLEVVLIDPTAAIPFGDTYNTQIGPGVDRAVCYDDGMQLLPMGLTQGELPIAGVNMVTVTVPGALPGDSIGSHIMMPVWYAQPDLPTVARPAGGMALTFTGDLNWLMAQKQEAVPGRYQLSAQGGTEVLVCAPPPGGINLQVDLGNWIRSCDHNSSLNIVGIAGTSLGVTQSGLGATSGLATIGPGGLSVTGNGLNIIWSGPGAAQGGFSVSYSETAQQAAAGPLTVTLSGTGVEFDLGSAKLAINLSSVLSAGVTQLRQSLANGTTLLQLFENGIAVASSPTT